MFIHFIELNDFYAFLSRTAFEAIFRHFPLVKAKEKNMFSVEGKKPEKLNMKNKYTYYTRAVA